MTSYIIPFAVLESGPTYYDRVIKHTCFKLELGLASPMLYSSLVLCEACWIFYDREITINNLLLLGPDVRGGGGGNIS